MIAHHPIEEVCEFMSRIFLIVLMSVLGINLAFTQVLLKRFLGVFLTIEGGILNKVLLSLQSRLFWATFASFLASSGLWIWILPRTKLSTVYPMISLSYVAMLFFAYFLEHEAIHLLHIVGVVLIMGGVVLLACSR